MNKQQLFNKSSETQARARMINTKAYGLVSAVVLAGAVSFAVGTGNVSADEQTATVTSSLLPTPPVKDGETVTITSESTSAPVKVEAVSETGYPSTNLTEKQPEPTAEHVEMTNNANKAGKEIVTPVETPELDKAVKKAKDAGVEVTEKPQVAHNTLAEAKADEKNQVKAIDEAKAEKIENTEAIKEANDTNEKIKQANKKEEARVKKLNEDEEASVKKQNEDEQARVKRINEQIAKDNKAKMATLGLTYTGDIEKDKKAIADYLNKAKLENQNGLKDFEEKKRQAKALHDKNRAIMEAKGLKYTGVWETDKATVAKWNKENAGERTVTTKETGLTATSSTTFEVVSGASKVTPPAYVQNVIQGYARNTNLDAKFDNVFLFDSTNCALRCFVHRMGISSITLNVAVRSFSLSLLRKRKVLRIRKLS